jgi:hypothetical protein
MNERVKWQTSLRADGGGMAEGEVIERRGSACPSEGALDIYTGAHRGDKCPERSRDNLLIPARLAHW